MLAGILGGHEKAERPPATLVGALAAIDARPERRAPEALHRQELQNPESEGYDETNTLADPEAKVIDGNSPAKAGAPTQLTVRWTSVGARPEVERGE
jgi:hypothetical protein